ncbi:Flavin monooxygenase-like protein [Cordyceps fumosorosea ARSEF 2679]|uniref:Flavin monooxygenase-like protein n=1 Tax=Cordyceps fumosorosea (strain ARSEF 2679) TaxID=1081104 RepID=A0A167V0F2_CORFA|nr:Flavin monooxygenase-like protein [Cordyceps fumosorosea ARSEF 2679]OAA62091.1 Flavin monooxygenase-like protein [Cordyceps fumosorosea ARSEF 2679]
MDVKSIAIIGAGSAGLAAAKYLMAEKKFSQIDIYEQRATTGGVWNTSPLDREPGFSIPRTTPTSEHEYATVITGAPAGNDRPGGGSPVHVELVSPVYDHLETNIPHGLMSYTDLEFPPGTALFPEHPVVLAYIQEYGRDVEHLIAFETQVRDVRKTSADDGTAAWTVEARHLKTGAVSSKRYDAVVVASGHYSDPFVPNVPGIAEFEAAHPGTIIHSKFYRRPEQFSGKKVLVVGNSASGIDISHQIVTTAQLPVLISEKGAPGADPAALPAPTSWSRHVGQVAELLPATRSARLTSGRVESGLDAVVFCTGYHYSFPFLTSLAPHLAAPDGTYADHLWEHLLYAPDATLAVLAVPKRVVPFPLAEAQAAVVARAWAGRLDLPARAERDAWVRRLVTEAAPAARHTLSYPQDADYIDRLYEMSARARPDAARGLEGGGAGKRPPYWDEETRWVRSQIFAIKVASRELGERRKECKTLADLGFDFNAVRELASTKV